MRRGNGQEVQNRRTTIKPGKDAHLNGRWNPWKDESKQLRVPFTHSFEASVHSRGFANEISTRSLRSLIVLENFNDFRGAWCLVAFEKAV